MHEIGTHVIEIQIAETPMHEIVFISEKEPCSVLLL